MMLRSRFDTPRPTLTSKPGESVNNKSSISSFSSYKTLDCHLTDEDPLKNTSTLSPIETSGPAWTEASNPGSDKIEAMRSDFWIFIQQLLV